MDAPAAQTPDQVQASQLVQLTNIGKVLARTHTTGSVTRYRGDPKAYRAWVRQIEKCVRVMTLPADEACAIAYQTAEGPPSDFIGRYIEGHNPTHWAELKPELQAHFAEVTDSQHALYVLRKASQGKDSAQVFGERVVELAEDAWPGQDLTAPLIQAQLVDIFVDGLTEKTIAKKVLRAATATLVEATQAATREQDWSRRFELRGLGDAGTAARTPRAPRMPPPAPPTRNARRETPMEVDRFRGKCHNCGRFGHKSIDCRSKRVNVQGVRETEGSSPGKGGYPRYGRRCWTCDSPDHLQRDCPQRDSPRRPEMRDATTSN